MVGGMGGTNVRQAQREYSQYFVITANESTFIIVPSEPPGKSCIKYIKKFLKDRIWSKKLENT